MKNLLLKRPWVGVVSIVTTGLAVELMLICFNMDVEGLLSCSRVVYFKVTSILQNE